MWEKGGSGDDEYAYGVVAALEGIAQRLLVFGGGEEDDAPSGLGRARDRL